jgi:hypothetical protein
MVILPIYKIIILTTLFLAWHDDKYFLTEQLTTGFINFGCCGGVGGAVKYARSCR